MLVACVSISIQLESSQEQTFRWADKQGGGSEKEDMLERVYLIVTKDSGSETKFLRLTRTDREVLLSSCISYVLHEYHGEDG